MFERVVKFQAKYRPDAVAISLPSGSATFADFDADIDRMASRLKAIVSPGASVAVQVASPGLHWVATLALARLGCVSASLPRIGERPEASLLSILRPDVLITDRDDDPAGADAILLTPGWIHETFTAKVEPVEAYVFQPDDPARIVLSSGTTGAPKKMLLTCRMVDARVRTGGLSQLAHKRLHSAVGLDTETGFRAPLVAWATGHPVLYPEAGFKWADYLLGSRPEVIVLVPAQLNAMLMSLPQGFPLQLGLNLVLVSGAPPASLYARARSQLTPNIFVTYGSTEAGLACQLSHLMLEKGEFTTGIVAASAEVEVVDEDHQEVPTGVSGRVRVRTEEMVAGYLDDAASTAAFFKDGWFYPGDLGSYDADGRLTLHGREIEVLDLGGLRIAPLAIEEPLLACEGVSDAAAFSVGTDRGVHRPCAAVVCDSQSRLEALDAALKKALPQLDVRLFRLDAVPRSERGKIMREAVRRLCLDHSAYDA